MNSQRNEYVNPLQRAYVVTDHLTLCRRKTSSTPTKD